MFISLITKNLLQRPLRYVLTGLAIAFGVAAVTAVFVFTDGLRTTFDGLAADIEQGYDVAIRSEAPFGDNLSVPPVPLSTLDRVAGLDSVVTAQPRIIEFGVIAVDDEGEPRIGTGPNIGLNWEVRTATPRLFVQDGREPTAAGEFALDVDGYEGGAFSLGQTYTVLAPTGSVDLELVGTFTFADEEQNASVGAVLMAFEEDYALSLLNDRKGYDDIVVTVAGDRADAIAEITPLLAEEGDTLVAVDQQDLIEESQGAFGQILGIFQTVLLVFAVIILLVSAFLIFNVFTITLGQRIKELGLLRSIGALGSQVTAMMLGEALILGIVATIFGLPAGWLLARLLRFALSQLGFPGDTGLPIRPTTIVYAIVVGVVVTLIAALFPSIRARRITPIAALRDGAVDSDLDTNPNRLSAAISIVVGVALIALGLATGGWIALLFLPLFGGIAVYLGVRFLGAVGQQAAKVTMLAIGLVLLTIVRFGDFPLGSTFGLLGAGALLTIVGASLVSGLFAGPVSRGLGMPVPMALLVGLIGVAFAGGAIAALVYAVVLFAEGNLAGIGLLIVAPVIAVLAYGLLRTAFGAFGLTGRIARENAARNPARTATTATALMIGLALVTGVTVIGESIKTSVSSALDSSISADLLIQGPNSGGPQGSPFSTEVADIASSLDEVELAVPARFSFAGFVHAQDATVEDLQQAIPTVFAALGADDPGDLLEAAKDAMGASELRIDDLNATDLATVLDHVDPDMVEIDRSVPLDQAIWLNESIAEERNVGLGDPFVVAFVDGAAVELTVAAIYADGFVLNNRVIDNSLWDQHLPSDTHVFLTVTASEGVELEELRTAVEAALAPKYPILSVQDRAEFAAEAEGQINQTLAVVNVLLLLSAAIAVLGIAIALSLSVFERTREIGLLRAVGTTRQQTRWIVRWEGVIVAAFGGLVGVIVGVGLGILATQKLPEFLVTTTAVPVGQLVIYVIIAAITGLGAGAFPAWIAGRMNVLDAISND